MNSMLPSYLPDAAFWRGKRVFLTGHSGFKGAWLTLWLESLGAKVAGYSLPPETSPNLHALLRLTQRCAQEHLADIRDYDTLSKALSDFAPEMVIHTAAQPLVRRSYREPLATLAVNIDGTAHLLEACRMQQSVRGVLVVTTDKCYRNKETLTPYGEEDELGGRDLYSASKACAEIVAHAYRQSFFEPSFAETGQGALVATARAGNVIGGGDWSEDRLLPDAVRAFAKGETLIIRSPKAVRPWQHVVEPLLGYLMLSRALLERGPGRSPAYNFGPDAESVVEVGEVIAQFSAHWPGAEWKVEPPKQPLHEATLLALDSSRAKRELGWQPQFTLPEALKHTADFYRAYEAGASSAELARLMFALCEEAGGRHSSAAIQKKRA